MSKGADTISSDWLAKFDSATSSGDIQAITALFLSHGWLRDVLIFTWSHRSLCGHDAIAAYLSDSDNLKCANVQNVKPENVHGIPASFVNNPGMQTMVQAAFTFETNIAHGKGFIRLLQDQDDQWKALSCFLTMSDLKGHEEQGFESGEYEGRTKTWNEVQTERRERIESDPVVIIIGAAQTGLNVGARFRQMNIPTLLIEKENAIGDVWRHRYPNLTLNTPKGHHAMLYQRYPTNWPKFTPRDKLASWLEQYALSHDLIVWTNTTIAPTPSYDPCTKRWTVNVLRNGRRVTLHPYHIVSAMGTLGKPWMPRLPGESEFKGEICHTTFFKGGSLYAGKKAIVIGTGNSGADICQDLATRGASSVTMVQRSATVVVPGAFISQHLDSLYNPEQDDVIGDFMNASMPLGLLRHVFASTKEQRADLHKEMLEGLEKAGFKTYEGPHGAGILLPIFSRFAGYWLDVGAANLIIKDKIKVKHGTEPSAFTPEGLVFKDGSTLEADIVVFATGYGNVVERVRDIFGDEVADKTGPVWGMNEEFELNRSYKPSGHPGFWYALGDFHDSRFYSKSLALQIKARELGLVKG